MTQSPRLTLYCDGASRGNPGPSAIGAVLYDETNGIVAEISRAIGVQTNNFAEYSALLAGLEEALKREAREIDIRMDSELAIKQLQGVYRVKNANLRPLYEKAKTLLARFTAHGLQHVPRAENKKADALANEALDRAR